MALAIEAWRGSAEEQLGKLSLTIGVVVQDQADDEEDDLDDDDVGGVGSGGDEDEEDEEDEEDYYPPGWSD